MKCIASGFNGPSTDAKRPVHLQQKLLTRESLMETLKKVAATIVPVIALGDAENWNGDMLSDLLEVIGDSGDLPVKLVLS